MHHLFCGRDYIDVHRFRMLHYRVPSSLSSLAIPVVAAAVAAASLTSAADTASAAALTRAVAAAAAANRAAAAADAAFSMTADAAASAVVTARWSTSVTAPLTGGAPFQARGTVSGTGDARAADPSAPASTCSHSLVPLWQYRPERTEQNHGITIHFKSDRERSASRRQTYSSKYKSGNVVIQTAVPQKQQRSMFTWCAEIMGIIESQYNTYRTPARTRAPGRRTSLPVRTTAVAPTECGRQLDQAQEKMWKRGYTV